MYGCTIDHFMVLSLILKLTCYKFHESELFLVVCKCMFMLTFNSIFCLVSQISMSVKTQVIILHVMNMPTVLTLRAVMSVPATLDSLEMDSTAQV